MSAASVRALYADAEAAILREVARRAALRPAGQPATAAELAAMRRYASRLFARQRAGVYREVRRTVTGARQADLLERLTVAERSAGASAAQLLREGGRAERLVGLVDSAGRRWSLSGYADVATTGAAQRQTLDRQLRDLRRNGVTHVRVRAEPGECAKCQPWDRKVLTLRELDRAIRAGLRHIRCRCSITRARPEDVRAAA